MMDRIIIKTGDITDACRKIRQEQYPDGLPTGEAVATTAGNLQAMYVIHTVGPIYHQCGERCAGLLSSCYTNVLKTALELGCDCFRFYFFLNLLISNI